MKSNTKTKEKKLLFMNGFKFRRWYDTKLNLYRYNNQAVFNLTNDLLDFLIISKFKIKNFKLHRYASFIPTWITKESVLLFKYTCISQQDKNFNIWNLSSLHPSSVPWVKPLKPLKCLLLKKPWNTSFETEINGFDCVR